jgi:V/A-type H+-transporting ATPase subunit A
MTEVLKEFPELEDPKTGKPLMDRTVLSLTLQTAVAAREACVYTGITIAEYFRDQGYDVALMADSTSRWAEAMREISGRLEEMPGEEGYPAYLASRLAQFYERAGRVNTVGTETEVASVSVVGAVSPPGGDLSEPVTQNTLRICKVFWALDASLADKRHFPSIDWLQSYSLYVDSVEGWWDSNVGSDWRATRDTAMALLQKESELQEIVQLVGPDALPDKERITLESTRMIRETSYSRTHTTKWTPTVHQANSTKCLKPSSYSRRRPPPPGKRSASADLTNLPVKKNIGRMKFIPEDEFDAQIKEIQDKIE